MGSFEPMFKVIFAASKVDSYDASGFEGATHVADFNFPVKVDCQYDTVIDSGTVEHIFNIPQALANISSLCRVGGQIIHVAPANNFCGHGFWQLSPELFFSLYSERNGFTDTEVFLAAVARRSHWFKVKPPSNGHRAEVRSSDPLYVLCRTAKQRDVPARVQQSDYLYAWQESANPTPRNGFVRWLRDHPPLFRVALAARNGLNLYRSGLNSLNPSLEKIRITASDTAPSRS